MDFQPPVPPQLTANWFYLLSTDTATLGASCLCSATKHSLRFVRFGPGLVEFLTHHSRRSIGFSTTTRSFREQMPRDKWLCTLCAEKTVDGDSLTIRFWEHRGDENGFYVDVEGAEESKEGRLVRELVQLDSENTLGKVRTSSSPRTTLSAKRMTERNGAWC